MDGETERQTEREVYGITAYIPFLVLQMTDRTRYTRHYGTSPVWFQEVVPEEENGTRTTNKQTKTRKKRKRFQIERNLLVSWCFEPSQPQRITSGLKHTN